MSVKINKSIKFSVFKFIIILFVVFWTVFAGVCIYNFCCRKFIYPLGYKQTVFAYSNLYGLDSALIFSVIKTESSFDKNAISDAGAKGLMQITESTGEYIAKMRGVKNYDLINPDDNINFGCYYIKYLLMRFNDMEVALCAYNAGQGRVDGWLNDIRYSRDGKTLYDLPFKETKDYIVKIKKTFSKYKKLYGNILDK